MSFLQQLFVTLVLSFSLISLIHAGEFHAILVGNTSDRGIAPGVRQNIKMMREEVARMAKFSGQPLQLAVFQGETATLKNITEYLDHLQVSNDDVILFYQSSHGIRSTLHEGIWPFLVYEEANTAIYFESIHDYLRSKNPRFLISIADVCNNVMEDVSHTDEKGSTDAIARAKYLKKETNKQIMTDCYKKLFLESKGTVITSGSKPGQFSFIIVKGWFSLKEGGLFTQSFNEALQIAARGKITSDWEQVLKTTKKLTEKRAKELSEEQTPQFILQKD